MNILVFGAAGKIGSAVAWDLARNDLVEKIGLVGRRARALRATADRIGSAKLAVHPLDIAERQPLQRLMSAYDVGVLALPDRRTSYKVAEAAVTCGLHIADMLEEYHRRPDPYETEGLELPEGLSLNAYGDWLHEQALRNDVTFLDGIGFAPGLSNITVGEGIRKLDCAEAAIARVGGIPAKAAAANHPLQYMITWAFSHVLREYMVNVNIRRNGRVAEVAATTGQECFRFDKFGRDEELECAITPGMPSFIFTRPELREFAEKTVRWPGHWQGIETLKACGLLDLEPVRHNGAAIVPREFFLTLIGPRLQPGEGEEDVCVMYNTVDGVRNGRKTRISYYMWEEADPALGMSAMARVTGFPAAISAVMIGSGEIQERGIVPPEDCLYGARYVKFMQELAKRNIQILDEETSV